MENNFSLRTSRLARSAEGRWIRAGSSTNGDESCDHLMPAFVVDFLDRQHAYSVDESVLSTTATPPVFEE